MPIVYGIILCYWGLLTFFSFASFQWFKKLENFSEKNLNKSYTNIASNGLWMAYCKKASKDFEIQVLI